MKKEGFIILGVLIFSAIIFTSLAHAAVVTNSTNSTNTTINPIFQTNSTNSTNTTISNSTNPTNVTNQTNSTTVAPTNSTNETIDNETQNQIGMMQSSGIGAKIRVLELQRSIEVKILEAQAVLSYIQTNKTSTNTSSLSDIITNLQALKNQIGNVSITNKTYTVQQFVNIKSQAMTLIKEFRSNASQYLNDSDKRSLKAQFNQIEKSSFKNLRSQIHSLQKQLWVEQVKNVLSRIGKKDQGLLNKLNQSNMTAQQIRQQLIEDYKNLSIKQRTQAQIKLREDAIKTEQEKLSTLRNIQKNISQRIETQKQAIQREIQNQKSGDNGNRNSHAPVKGLNRGKQK